MSVKAGVALLQLQHTAGVALPQLQHTAGVVACSVSDANVGLISLTIRLAASSLIPANAFIAPNRVRDLRAKHAFSGVNLAKTCCAPSPPRHARVCLAWNGGF